MIHDVELEFINFIHQFRNPLFDNFFKFLDYFDRPEFFFILIPIIWFGQGWKTGLRLFYILQLNGIVNHALKQFFLSPRPFHLDPDVGIIQVSGLGFPSGAAQTVILLSGLLLSGWKSSWKWMVVLTYILLVSFSRVYLGVHFPSDILAGWCVGFGLLNIYLYGLPLIEKQLEKLQPAVLFLVSQLVSLLLLICQYSVPNIRICSVVMGMGIGLLIVNHFQLFQTFPKNIKEYVLRSAIGVLGSFACYLFSLVLHPSSIFYLFSLFLVLGLWLSLGSNFIGYNFFKNYKIPLEVSHS